MKITAAQMVQGIVTSMREDQANVEVVIRLQAGQEITAVLTKSSVKNLGLTIGKPFFRKTQPLTR